MRSHVITFPIATKVRRGDGNGGGYRRAGVLVCIAVILDEEDQLRLGEKNEKRMIPPSVQSLRPARAWRMGGPGAVGKK